MIAEPPGPVRRAGIAQGLTLVISAFLPILAIVTLTSAVPTIIDHFRGQSHVALLVTLMVSVPGLSIAILAPFAGVLADRFGRRKLLVGATLLYGAAGVAPFFLDNLIAIIGSRLILGTAEAAILTLVNTLIGDYWRQDARRRWLVIQGVIGPALATGVIAASGALTSLRWNAVFLIYAVAFPIFVAMYLFIFEPAGDVDEASSTAEALPEIVAHGRFPYGIVAAVCITTLFCSTLFYVFIIQGGLAFREVGITNPTHLGILVSAASLAVPAGALLYGLLGRHSVLLQMFVFLMLLGGGLAAIGLAQGYRSMFVGLIFQQLGAGMTVPLLVAWVASRLPFAHRGRGMGAWAAAFFLGQFISPLVVQAARSATGTVQGAFIVTGTAGCIAALVALVWLLRNSRVPAATPIGHAR